MNDKLEKYFQLLWNVVEKDKKSTIAKLKGGKLIIRNNDGSSSELKFDEFNQSQVEAISAAMNSLAQAILFSVFVKLDQPPFEGRIKLVHEDQNGLDSPLEPDDFEYHDAWVDFDINGIKNIK